MDGSHGHDNDWVSRVIEESASADKTQALVETQIDDWMLAVEVRRTLYAINESMSLIYEHNIR